MDNSVEVNFFYSNGSSRVLDGRAAYELLDDGCINDYLVALELTYSVPIMLNDGTIVAKRVVTKYILGNSLEEDGQIKVYESGSQPIDVVKRSIKALLVLYEKFEDNKRVR